MNYLSKDLSFSTVILFSRKSLYYPSICAFIAVTFFLIMIKRLIEHAVKEKYEKRFIFSPDLFVETLINVYLTLHYDNQCALN